MATYDSVVITGGGGMLARALREVLELHECRVTNISRSECDVTNPQDIRRLFDQYRPTLLLNCAAHTKVDLCEDEPDKANAINGHAVGLLTQASREHGTVLVHYSTDFVFNGSSPRPYRTNDPVNPLSVYGRSKLLGEQKLQENAPARWLILRTAWLYGRGGPSFPRTMVERGRQGPLKVVNDQIGCPTYTVDLARATLDLLDRNLTGLWHVTNSGSMSWFDFARATLEEFGVSTSLNPLSTAEWLAIKPKQATRPAYSVLDVSPFEKATGRPMRPWREALRDFRDAVVKAGSF